MFQKEPPQRTVADWEILQGIWMSSSAKVVADELTDGPGKRFLNASLGLYHPDSSPASSIQRFDHERVTLVAAKRIHVIDGRDRCSPCYVHAKRGCKIARKDLV